MAEKFAVKGWHLAQKQGGVSQQQRRHYSTGASRSSVPVELLTGGVLPPRLAELKERLAGFMADHVFPVESQLEAHQSSAQRWTVSPIIEELKVGGAWCVWPVSAVCVCAQVRAKEHGLWNLFIPLEADPECSYGAGLTNLEYAHLAELMGRCVYASEVRGEPPSMLAAAAYCLL